MKKCQRNESETRINERIVSGHKQEETILWCGIILIVFMFTLPINFTIYGSNKELDWSSDLISPHTMKESSHWFLSDLFS